MTLEERAEELARRVMRLDYLAGEWDDLVAELGDALRAYGDERAAQALKEAARLVYPKVHPPTISQEAFDIGVSLAAALRALADSPPEVIR